MTEFGAVYTVGERSIRDKFVVSLRKSHAWKTEITNP